MDHLRTLRRLAPVVSVLLLFASPALAQHNVRVAQYNIQFLSTDVQNQGNGWTNSARLSRSLTRT